MINSDGGRRAIKLLVTEISIRLALAGDLPDTCQCPPN